MIASYIVPILNILIILGIKRENFSFDINIINIILVTNACFLASLCCLINFKSEYIKTFKNITLMVVIVLFAFAIVQNEIQEPIFTLNIYKYGTLVTFLASFFLGLISKYDEVEAQVEAESIARAKKWKEIKEIKIGGKSIKL
ncbi:MAG: hypothetical protein PHD45_01615 [Bacteroidales bacterium]|nr:hypothetical protein [Bacteroidales bacterium]